MPGSCISLYPVLIDVVTTAVIGATAYFWMVVSLRSKEQDPGYRLLVILTAVALIEMGVFVNYSLLRWKIC